MLPSGALSLPKPAWQIVRGKSKSARRTLTMTPAVKFILARRGVGPRARLGAHRQEGPSDQTQQRARRCDRENRRVIRALRISPHLRHSLLRGRTSVSLRRNPKSALFGASVRWRKGQAQSRAPTAYSSIGTEGPTSRGELGVEQERLRRPSR
jgi:hypothetical protein